MGRRKGEEAERVGRARRGIFAQYMRIDLPGGRTLRNGVRRFRSDGSAAGAAESGQRSGVGTMRTEDRTHADTGCDRCGGREPYAAGG